MKYKDLKVGDRYYLGIFEVEVISKSGEYKIITTIDSDGNTGTWLSSDFGDFMPLQKELPEEGLLVSKLDSLVYKLSDGSGYGFSHGNQSDYFFGKRWGLSNTGGHWKPATPEQEKKFIAMIKKECEKHGLYEDTKLERNNLSNSIYLNENLFIPETNPREAWNKNGQIFYRGKFAT